MFVELRGRKVSILKPALQRVHDASNLFPFELEGVNSYQTQELVKKIRKIEADSSVSSACHRYLSTTLPKAAKTIFKHRTAHGV